jgi:carboxyl-terminal processing protease
MSKTTRRILSLSAALLACGCLTYTAGFIAAFRSSYDKAYSPPERHSFESFWQAWTLTEGAFYGEVPSAQERTYGAIHQALELLEDPYTFLLEPIERELEQDRIRGAYGGIGADLWHDAEGRMVLYPYDDSPAARAGVEREDVLVAVDGMTLTAETTVDEARALLRGEVGTTVTTTISRPPLSPFDLPIEREQISIPSVTWRYLSDEHNLAYVRIHGFTERTDTELGEALELIRGTLSVGLVLDLRGNAGGLINSAVSVASEFIEDGVVLYETGREGEERVFSVRGEGLATGIPLAVLIDSGTASAAEIVAGALQDYDRAPLIGVRTYGKGSVQLIFSLSDGSSLHLTSKIWLTPDRNQIQGRGLEPDISVSLAPGGQDEQLLAAVDYLQGQPGESGEQ